MLGCIVLKILPKFIGKSISIICIRFQNIPYNGFGIYRCQIKREMYI